MTAKHSPKPWKVLQHYSQNVYDGQIVVDAEGWGICNLWHNHHTQNDDLLPDAKLTPSSSEQHRRCLPL